MSVDFYSFQTVKNKGFNKRFAYTFCGKFKTIRENLSWLKTLKTHKISIVIFLQRTHPSGNSDGISKEKDSNWAPTPPITY